MAVRYVVDGEDVSAENANRPLRDALTEMGLDPDGAPIATVETPVGALAKASAAEANAKGYTDTRLASRDRYQAGGTGGGPCLIAGSTTNAIAEGLLDCTIAGGGHSGRENVIGAASTANVGTNNSNLPLDESSGASFSSIGGGYDNVANGLASTISGGAHHKIEKTTTHGTIGGGSLNSITGGSDYGVIHGGTGNTVSGDSATVGGGTTNTASGLQSTVGGGGPNTASASFSTVAGGSGNTATATNATVGGGAHNDATGASATVAGGNTNVAASPNSTIGGGFTNTTTAVADYSTIAGGRQNSAQEDYAAIGGGQTNTASGAYAVVCGGLTNIASAQYAAVLNGSSNTADVEAAVALGVQAHARLPGGVTQAYRQFAAQGDSQTTVLTARIQTTSATAANLRLDGSTARITIPDQTTWCFVAYVVARRTDADNESAAYKIEGCMDRNTGSATAALVGTPTVTTIAEDTAAWGVAATVVNGALEITCTGEAAKTVNWVARVTLVEVTG